jgi:hypothetical protein
VSGRRYRLKRSPQLDRGRIPQALECIANLVIAATTDMGPHIADLLDSMFSGGLNETLINTLTVIRYEDLCLTASYRSD